VRILVGYASNSKSRRSDFAWWQNLATRSVAGVNGQHEERSALLSVDMSPTGECLDHSDFDMHGRVVA
jgi:hypothetical protein